ncbi:NusA-like transcription termination signal-binding factor [Candidatus Micrarchaeota archaeon]|nr:NusA-like transcription termination signal-binding factor [Candidatus Micrarchaeota archaeon]
MELTGDDLTIFSTFEKITHVMPTDYLSTTNSVIFVVDPQSLGKAIGAKGANIEKLGGIFRKRVVIIGDSEQPEGFVRSFFGNIKIENIEERNVMGERVFLVTVDEKDRGIAIGREGERVKAAKTLLKKKFNATLQVRTQGGMRSRI